MDALFATPNRRIVACAVVATAAGLAALVMVPAAVRSIFSSNFLPHAYCYLQDRDLIALHLGSDAVIWLSYVAISCTLVYLVWRTRREIPFSWMFLAFGTFIVACGFTHFMEMVVLWKPLYWLSADIKLLTALASLITAIALPTLIPQVHGMVAAAHLSEERKAQLEQANGELQRLSAQVMNVQDAERRRLARELHDGVGQYLAAIKMSCDVALAEAKGRSDVISHALHDLHLLDRYRIAVLRATARRRGHALTQRSTRRRREIWNYDSALIPVAGRQVRVNKYSIDNSGQRMLMFYWYQSRQRIIASEYLGKLL